MRRLVIFLAVKYVCIPYQKKQNVCTKYFLFLSFLFFLNIFINPGVLFWIYVVFSPSILSIYCDLHSIQFLSETESG